MTDLIIKLAVMLMLAIIGAVLSALVNFIKSKLSAKTLAKVEKIAAVIEQLYDGCTSAEKLNAFKEICKAKDININKAVNYLEQHIIPISKGINCYEIIEQQKDDTEVTN